MNIPQLEQTKSLLQSFLSTTMSIAQDPHEDAEVCFANYELGEALQVALDALAKQIPIEPIQDKDLWLCGNPECKMNLTLHPFYKQMFYCPRCGQVILWKHWDTHKI